jgi:hypothetical protein
LVKAGPNAYLRAMPSKPPALASKPVYEPALQAVVFEFWKGDVRQAGSFKISNMSAEAALDYFMVNWAKIGILAARTPPTDGEVRLRFADPGTR